RGPATVRVDFGVAPPLEGAAPETNVRVDVTGASGDPSGTRRTIAFALGGAALVAAGVGAAFGVVAIHKVDSSNEGNHCIDDRCDAVGARLRDDARSPAALSTAFIVGGAVAIAAGVVLYLTAPRARTPTTAGIAF